MDYYIKSAKNQPSIIDSFLIIGYDIQEQEIKMSGDGKITLVNPNPTVLSEVSAFNTTRKIILENQLIYNIFPEPPPIYSINIISEIYCVLNTLDFEIQIKMKLLDRS